MALIILQVVVLGVTAAALHGVLCVCHVAVFMRVDACAYGNAIRKRSDVPITWSHSNKRAVLPCVVPEWSRRRPPPLLDEERTRSKGPYVWWRADTEFGGNRIYPNGTLEVKKGDGEAVYQCGVRQRSNLVLGYPVNLKFPYMDKQFSEHPGSRTAFAGQPTVLSCTINSGPPANISWERDGAALPQDARYHVLENQLIITDVKQADNGAYRCKARNPYLNRVTRSHAARLQVEKSEDQDLTFLDIYYEKNVTAARGSQVLLACPVVGWPRPKLIWELTPADGRTYELDITEEILVLSQLEYDQEGVYSCSVEGHSDLVKTFNVSLWEPVKITLPPASKETMRASTVRFNCTATGRPKPTISWFKDGRLLTPSGRFNLRTSIDKARIELVISGVTSDDEAIYQCFASNQWSVATSWAALSVRGPSAAPPANVTCAPVAPNRVEVRWWPIASNVTAYTVHITPIDRAGEAKLGQPHTNTEEIVTVKEALTPYVFQVRAFVPRPLPDPNKWQGVPSDMSDKVICQGQGIPVEVVKLKEDAVLVTWQQFWSETAGVAQWILQHRTEGETREHNITLDGGIYNYTLIAPPSAPLEVRVLGSRTIPWMPQDLSLLTWESTANAVAGDSKVVLKDLELGDVGPRSFSAKWRVEGDADGYTYMVCVRRPGGIEDCRESLTNSTTVDGLQSGEQYEVRVSARLPGRPLDGAISDSVQLVTQHEASPRFKELSYKFLNSSTLRVSWGSEPGPPRRYTVRHNTKLELPVEDWDAVEVFGNTATIHGIRPTDQTFVMVTGYQLTEYSQILNIPAQSKDFASPRFKELNYKFENSTTLRVSWAGEAGAPRHYTVRHNIKLEQPVEDWDSIDVIGNTATIHGIHPSDQTFIMVTGYQPTEYSQILNIPSQTKDSAASPRFKELSYKFLNSSTLRVSWAGETGPSRHYTVRHNTKLELPVEDWDAVEVVGDTATIYGINTTDQTFVMMTGYQPIEYSQILNIPAQAKDFELKDLKYSYSSLGVTVSWSVGEVAGEKCKGSGVVRYSQNITRPLERWNAINVTECSVELKDLESSLPLYVMVTMAGHRRHSQMLTIQPRPVEESYLYLGIGIGGGLVALCLLVLVAICIWRRRKRARSPNRRRRIASGDETIEDEGSEMKSVSTTGGRLANGGVRDAGEPLLNGHVHITENPASKTPNGRMKKSRNYNAFDVSRHDADTTAETVLDDSTAYSLLDTSRQPEFDVSSRDISKLPDDNMNSELNRSITLDNSKIHPTLQPNG